MTTANRALEHVINLLATSERYPWKTASYLSRRLAEKCQCKISAKDLEAALIEHSHSEDRVLRYSFFPARKTLDLLWGHKAQVHEFADLPALWLHDDPGFRQAVGEIEACTVADDATWCFLSHSFRDVRTVLALRDDLVAIGYGVWMAEAEIQLGGMITEGVQEGLKRADRLVVYMTRNSLASRWVLKETGVAVHQWHLPPTVVVDGNDPELGELFASWVDDGWDATFPARLQALLPTDESRDRAATAPHELLVSALGEVEVEHRLVVKYPAAEPLPPGSFQTLTQAFPCQG